MEAYLKENNNATAEVELISYEGVEFYIIDCRGEKEEGDSKNENTERKTNGFSKNN